jgi:hypothetical protein
LERLGDIGDVGFGGGFECAIAIVEQDFKTAGFVAAGDGDVELVVAVEVTEGDGAVDGFREWLEDR